MKKITLILGVTALTFGAISCKKDYTCACTYEELHEEEGEEAHYDKETANYPIGKAKKSDAETACDGYATILKADPDHKDVNCELK
jgi:hypothetical protein